MGPGSRWGASAGPDDVGHAVRLGRRWRRCECSAVGDDGGGDREAIGHARAVGLQGGSRPVAPPGPTALSALRPTTRPQSIVKDAGSGATESIPYTDVAVKLGRLMSRTLARRLTVTGWAIARIHRSSVEKELGR